MYINTYIIFDLETTSLPQWECYKSKIIELSMIAVNRAHLSENKIPRVQNKITLCFQPNKTIKSSVHGLYNDMLEHEDKFNENTFNLLNAFLNKLKKPICLIAHNGDKFDFPLLQQELHYIKKYFPDDIYCADSLIAFRKILKYPYLFKEENQVDNIHKEIAPNNDCDNEDVQEVINIFQQSAGSSQNIQWQTEGESTPKQSKQNELTRINFLKRKSSQSKITDYSFNVKRRLFPDCGLPPSFKLIDIYKHMTKKEPINSHYSESDCNMLLECIAIRANDFSLWIDQNAVLFNTINRFF